MVYEIPESKRSKDQNKWEFKVPGDDRVYKILKAKYLPLGLVEKLEGQKNVTLADIFAMFDAGKQTKAEIAETSAVHAAIRTLDGEQLQALTEAWQNDSGVQLGESSAS